MSFRWHPVSFWAKQQTSTQTANALHSCVSYFLNSEDVTTARVNPHEVMERSHSSTDR